MRELRSTVFDLPDYLTAGMTEESILADSPDLDRDHISAVLAYAANRE
jgi:uncharacterized protein (DUF433 family)